MHRSKIAVLASGSGSTAESFIRSAVANEVNGDVVLVISNNKDAKVLKRVEALNKEFGLQIKAKHIGKSNYPPSPGEVVEYGAQTSAEEKAILEELRQMKIGLVLLLGYMKLVGSNIVKEYGWKKNYQSVYEARMLNTHPGLLPDTKGLFGIHVQEAALKSGNGRAGHCLFAVDSEYDDGPVICEHRVAVEKTDTPEILFERVKDSEKTHLAADVNNFILEQAKTLTVQ